jgi:ATPase family protein associated with various cellular activities (AAA)
MQTLHDDLERLRKLNGLREQAFELRDSGYRSLRDIEGVDPGETRKISPEKYATWQGLGNALEATTLLKIRRHWRLSRGGEGPPTKSFEQRLNVSLSELFAEEANTYSASEEMSNELLDRRVPVLVAALCMELRSEQSATVLSFETILCYYRILVEMNLATWPDWTVGAARAGDGAMVTAFVTGECVRAIMAFQRAIDNTAVFLQQTRFLFERHKTLIDMSDSLQKPDGDHPVTHWSNFALKRMWLDWFIATDPERRAIALSLYAKDTFKDPPTLEELELWFKGLRDSLAKTTLDATTQLEDAYKKIKVHERDLRKKEKKSSHHATVLAKQHARAFGFLVMKTALEHARDLQTIASKKPESPDDLPEVLKFLETRFKAFSIEVGRILDVSKHYVERVLDRALADPANIDIGELAFAAAAYGSATDWQSKQRLKRVCAILLQSIPPSGLPVTRIPFHSTRRGYKLLPTGCHIIGSLALLLIKTGYEFEPDAVEPLFHAIESRKIVLRGKASADDTMGWNFEGSERNSPSVWVTGVTVLALDRMIRMLDARINAIVFDHFTVEQAKPARGRRHSLNDLVYPDYGLTKYARPGKEPMAILLERLRSHLAGVKLPLDGESASSSVILHGPPGTGKTTWAEALAQSAEVPLIRLSPFDLIATPRGPLENVSIQTRARQVFEALSMLTGSVILFDEFEAVFWRRDEGKDPKESDKTLKGHREEIAFLQTGLLPMLNRLHDVAGPQNLVYCLATNYLDVLDNAVTRKGRFDLKLEVNRPDPLSRAGTFLYRAASIRRALRKRQEQTPAMIDFCKVMTKGAADGLFELIKATRGNATSELVTYFNLPQWAIAWSHENPAEDSFEDDAWKSDVPLYLRIFLGGITEPENKQQGHAEESGKDETEDLRKYEEALLKAKIASLPDASSVLKCLSFSPKP